MANAVKGITFNDFLFALRTQEFITLYVGSDRTPYHATNDIIGSCSSRFRDLLISGNTIELPNENTEVIEIFLAYLLSNQLEKPHDMHLDRWPRVLVRIWLFAHHWGVHKLADYATTEICDCYARGYTRLGPPAFEVFSRAPRESTLYRLYIKMCARYCPIHLWAAQQRAPAFRAYVYADLVYEMSCILNAPNVRERPGNFYASLDRCEFHEHADGTPWGMPICQAQEGN